MEEQEKMVFCENHEDVAAIDICAFCGKAICYRCKKRFFGVAFCGFRCAARMAFQAAGGAIRNSLRKLSPHPGTSKKKKSVPGRFSWKRIGILFDVLLFLGLVFSIHRILKMDKEFKSAGGGRGNAFVIAPADTSSGKVEGVFRPTQGGMVTANALDISGEAEADRIVSLAIDGRLNRVTLPQDGKFLFDKVKLHRGVNRIEVRAITQDGRVSLLQAMTLTYGAPTVDYLVRDFQRGPLDSKEMAFTFDGGASDNAAGEILDALKAKNIKATFFLTGEFIHKYPALVRRIVSEGHDVGDHTWSHPHLTTFSNDRKQTTTPGITADRLRSELLKTASIFRTVTGRDMVALWRAPFGEYNAEILRWAAEAGFRHVAWTTGRGWAESMDSMDWVADKKSSAYHSAQEIEDKILAYAKTGRYGANGIVILMHLGTERRDDYPHEKLPEIIDGLKKQGYAPVKVAELMAKAETSVAAAAQKGEREAAVPSAPIPH
jgi:peptidoglycan/xylan/chitin deacetylase (PgdA/CDA1 family)